MSNENKTIHEFDFNFICDYFSTILPANYWTEHFFAPLIKVQELFLEKYKEFYGYVFYIAKKTAL